mgnify:CR=1 FL=1|tara:strand:+ start:139 stop:282 length:144 start_codon:yes stop_codon:yes gene_type:complete
MVLYTEQQLESCYKVYCKEQSLKEMPFMALTDFRVMFEKMMECVYKI